MITFQENDVGEYWPQPKPEDDKYSRGVVGIDTGSKRYPGAAVLSVLGALYAGAGFIRFCGTTYAQAALLQQAPSVTFGFGRADAWLVGCGWNESVSNQVRLMRLIETNLPMVIDASALPILPESLPPGSLLTPHAGELARMMGMPREAVEADPTGVAVEAARRWDTCVLLKGHQQYVADPSGDVMMPLVGPPWTAQAGSGDVLAGIAASLIAQGCKANMAGCLAASIQALAASRHPGPYPPNDLVRFLPDIIASF